MELMGMLMNHVWECEDMWDMQMDWACTNSFWWMYRPLLGFATGFVPYFFEAQADLPNQADNSGELSCIQLVLPEATARYQAGVYGTPY
eukprot:3599785-Pleurochrysis_carterae.AAC.2